MSEQYDVSQQRVVEYLAGQPPRALSAATLEDPVGYLMAEHREMAGRLRAGEVPSFFKGGPQTPQSVRDLCNRIWQTTHAQQGDVSMLADLSLLAGVAVGMLMDYANDLEKATADEPAD